MGGDEWSIRFVVVVTAGDIISLGDAGGSYV